MFQLENICREIFLLSLCKYLRALSPSTLGNIMSNLEEKHFLEDLALCVIRNIFNNSHRKGGYFFYVIASFIHADIDETKS